MAVLNNWYTAAADPRSPVTDAQLCMPSLGDAFTADRFSLWCGASGPDAKSTTVCAGDLLKVRATIANYSTSTADAVSTGSHTDDIPAGSQRSTA